MNKILIFALALSASNAFADDKADAADGAYLLLQNISRPDVLQARTLWVKVSPKGTEILGEFPSRLIAAGGTLYELTSIDAEYQSYDCDEDLSASNNEDGKKAKPRTLKYTRTVLRDALTSKALWTSPAAPFNIASEYLTERAGEFSNSSSLNGLVGPYLSLQSCDYTFDCGPHGNDECESHTFDLSKATDLGDKAQKLFKMPDAKEKKALKWEFGDLEPIKDGQANFATWDSTYDAKGLKVSLMMWHDSSYAASSHEWSSGTTTADFAQKKLPKEFEAYKELPKALSEFASTKNIRLLGFSRVTKSEAVDRYLSSHAKPANPAQ